MVLQPGKRIFAPSARQLEERIRVIVMKSFLESIALSILIVFAPIKATLLAVLALIVADFITGIIAAYKRKEPITSAGFKRSIGKIFLYEVALALSFMVHQYLTGDLLPADKLVAALIGVTELKSVLENLDSISGTSFLQTIIAKVTQSQNDIGK